MKLIFIKQGLNRRKTHDSVMRGESILYRALLRDKNDFHKHYLNRSETNDPALLDKKYFLSSRPV